MAFYAKVPFCIWCENRSDFPALYVIYSLALKWYHKNVINNIPNNKGEILMNVKKRILAIQLADKIQQNPEYAKQIGVSAELKYRKIYKEKNIK